MNLRLGGERRNHSNADVHIYRRRRRSRPGPPRFQIGSVQFNVSPRHAPTIPTAGATRTARRRGRSTCSLDQRHVSNRTNVLWNSPLIVEGLFSAMPPDSSSNRPDGLTRRAAAYLLFHKLLCPTDADTVWIMKQIPAREGTPSRTRDALPPESRVARDIEMILARRVPPGWTICSEPAVRPDRRAVDLVLTLTSPDGETVWLAVDVKSRVEPRRVPELARRLREFTTAELPSVVPVLGASYLSPRTREMLREFDVGYIDTTGNVRIVASTPGLFISADGADKDPWPRRDVLQSLRGRGAARAVRAIVDVAPPFGVRELAAATGTSAPTLSRVLGLLEREGVVSRQGRGKVGAVDWEGVIRRWATDYDQAGSNTVTACLEPRGLAAVTGKLATTTVAYAATGAFAAQHFDPIAPAAVASLYVADAVEAAESLDLRETDAGRERHAPGALRPGRVRPDRRTRRPEVRRSDPTRRRPAHRPRPRALPGRADADLDEAERRCLARLIRCTCSCRTSSPPSVNSKSRLPQMAPGSHRTDPRTESRWIEALNTGLDLPGPGATAVSGPGRRRRRVPPGAVEGGDRFATGARLVAPVATVVGAAAAHGVGLPAVVGAHIRGEVTHLQRGGRAVGARRLELRGSSGSAAARSRCPGAPPRPRVWAGGAGGR